MTNKLDFTADEIQIDLKGLGDEEVSRCILKVLQSYLGVLQQRYSSGKTPDGGKQKSLSKFAVNARGEEHPLAGQPSELVDTGALRKSMIASRRGENKAAKIILVGTHPGEELNARIGAKLNEMGFKNTYIASKDLDMIVKSVVTCLMSSTLRNLVQIKK